MKQLLTVDRRALVYRLCFCLFFFVPVSLPAQASYIQKFKPLADSLAQVYAIPSTVILGVASLESGYGTSFNARRLHNHFGIEGKNDLLKTKGVKNRYKQYTSDTLCYIDFCKLVSRKKYYPTLKGDSDYKKWIDAMSRSGYSEVPAIWKQRVVKIIQSNQKYF